MRGMHMVWKNIAIVVIAILLPSIAEADGWSCRNKDMQISCNSEKCSVAEDFTPIDVSFDERGSLNICAYSGCWEGRGKVLQSENHLLISGHELRWSGTTPVKGSFMIAFDKKNNIAVINGETFAMPIVCMIEKDK